MGFGGASIAIAQIPERVRSIGSGGVERNHVYTQYSAEGQRGYAELEYGRMIRNVERGRDLGKDNQELARAVNKLEESLAPLQTFMAEVGTDMLTLLVDLVRIGVDLSPAVHALKEAAEWYQWLKGEEESDESKLPLTEMVNNLASIATEKKERRM